MGRIEVDEEKLRRFVNASLFTCMDLSSSSKIIDGSKTN